MARTAGGSFSPLCSLSLLCGRSGNSLQSVLLQGNNPWQRDSGRSLRRNPGFRGCENNSGDGGDKLGVRPRKAAALGIPGSTKIVVATDFCLHFTRLV